MLELVLLIICTVLFVFVAWRRLDWALALAVVLSPTYQWRFELWLVPMTFLEVMILAIVAVWLLRHAILIKQSRQQYMWWPWKWLTLLFILAGVVAVLISPDTRQALGLWKAYVLEPVLFFIILVNEIKTHRQLRLIMAALGALVVVIGFISMLQYLDIVPIAAHYGSESPPRATSVFAFPTAVGKLIGPLVALFMAMWLVPRQKKVISLDERFVRVFIVGVVCFGVIGLLLSVSRGALLGLLAAVIFLSFFSRWKKWLWLGIVGLVLLALLIPQTRNNITSVFQATDVSADVHLVMWKGAVRIIEENPVTGTGLASFPVVYEQYKEASHTEFFPNPDHFILSVWIEMGLAGLLLFIWLIVRFFSTGIRVIKQKPEYKIYAIGLLVAIIVIIVHGLVDTPYFKNDLAVVFWALVGLMVIMANTRYTNNDNYFIKRKGVNINEKDSSY